ncbi:MAG TPA: hypothetical protein VK897_00505 [Anaerolineales bacterium]|nr:hypothetical protein [Anaerolineales bacterium]
MSRRSNLFSRPGIYIACVLYIALTYALLAMGNEMIAATTPEDHYFELIGSFALLVTSLLFLYGFFVARKTLDKSWMSLVKKLVYLALALLFFFGAGEEISWGQRILGFQTPEQVAEVNTQEEFNTHNLAVWQNSGFLDANRLFDAFWFLFAVLTPVAAMLVPAFRQFARRFIPLVHWAPGALFIYNYLWAKLAKVIFAGVYAFEKITLTQAVQEIKESNYAIIFILVGVLAVLDLRKSEAGSAVARQRSNIKAEPAFHE